MWSSVNSCCRNRWITHDNIKELTGSKIDGIAVISAIYGANNIKNAASGLKEEISKIVE